MGFDYWRGNQLYPVATPGNASTGFDYWRGNILIPAVVVSSGNPQYARPSGTISAFSWTAVGAATIHEATDEVTPSMADYARSPVSPTTASSFRVSMSSLSDPASSADHFVRYAMGKDTVGGHTLTVTPSLYQGTTLISTGPSQVVPDYETTYEWELSGAEADNITDYADLRVDISVIRS